MLRPRPATVSTATRQFSSNIRRNKALADIIRDGIAHLNGSAAKIQNSRHSKKPLFPTPVQEQSPRQLAEEQRILSVATDCLEDLSQKHPKLCLQGEPVQFLAVRVKPSLRIATLYWTHPVLHNPKLEKMQRHYIEYTLAKNLEEMLPRKVQAILRAYYPPKLKFEPAPPILLHEYFDDRE